MRVGRSPKTLLALALCLLIGAASTGTSRADTSAPTPPSAPQAYPTSSWALGIVVPQGAGLEDGGKLRWDGAANVTAEFRLPNITLPDRIVYTVLSVMTGDGAVLQAAAGVYPNRSVWLAYSWSIPSIRGGAPTYHWILNGSGPAFAAGALASVSIYRGAGTWNLRLQDVDTGEVVSRPFPSGPSPSLMVGDQEVFALESYSRSRGTFQSMGNLTLVELSVDGQKVTSGAYAYGDWDPMHNPVFVVGSSGAAPPGFISLRGEGEGSYVWGYVAPWATGGGNGEGVGMGYLVLILAGAVVVGVLAIVVTRSTMRTAPKRESKSA